MHRRDVLTAGLTIGALGRPSFGGGRLLESVRSLSPPPPINRTEIEATVRAHSAARIEFELEPAVDLRAVTPVVARRSFPSGTVLSAVAGPSIDLTADVSHEVSMALPDRRVHEIASAWQDECWIRTGDEDRAFEYLCASAPQPGRRELRLSEPATPTRHRTERMVVTRQHRPDRYETRFEWENSRGTPIELTYPVSVTAFERARDRTDGYLSGVREARRSPFAADLLGEIDAQTSPSARGGAVSPRTQLFERVVRFVQSIPYARDADSMGTYDYHRRIEEILVDGVTDCKDGTYLLAGLLGHPPLACETALVAMPNHLLLGVHADDLPPAFRDRSRLADSPYVGIETTVRRPVGSIPNDPIVAILGRSHQQLDLSVLDEVVVTQLHAFAALLG